MFYSRFKKDLLKAKSRIAFAGLQIAHTRLGKIEYTIFGEGLPVLWVHGIVGGADQARITSQPLITKGFQIIAVSRFGYIGSPLPKEATPSAQADLYNALLDELKIPEISVVGFSSGGPSSIQFALKYPERCTSLTLLSAAVPPYKIPNAVSSFFANKFFKSDLLIWSLVNYFPSIMMRMMGVPKSIQKKLSDNDRNWLTKTMASFLPVSLRVKGILNDMRVTNPDMNKGYPFNELAVQTFIIHAVDDPLPSFTAAKKLADQIPHSKFLIVGNGGHLHLGHQPMISTLISSFIIKTHTARSLQSMNSLQQVAPKQ
jgi:pimeloyl-ACP methyl ester carboxylesterase